jgi:hypothetical protein
LEEATEDMLDTKRLPFGSLSEDDVESIAGLMAAWVRRRSVDAALTVEQLLKRVVDDMRAQNPDVFVTTKMYTIVSLKVESISGLVLGSGVVLARSLSLTHTCRIMMI